MLVRLIINALRQIARQPFRTLLVLQGVIWGTALGVFPSSLIQGSFQRAERDAATSGIDRILVTIERRQREETLSWADIEALRNSFAPDIKALAGYGLKSVGGKDGIKILATDTNALASRSMSLAAGRFFTAEEFASGSPVCVLDEKFARRRFGSTNPIGQSLSAGTIRFTVIGIATGGTSDDVDEFGYEDGHVMSKFIRGLQKNLGAIQSGPIRQLSQAENMMVPRTVFPNLPPTIVEIRAEPKRILDLRASLRSHLITSGHQPVIFTNALLPFLYRETLNTFLELNRIVFLLCVVVGTCVVCVLMVLSVVERAREIAIRRVEGARRDQIALQFIVETGTICAVGGVLGVPLGMALAAVRVRLEPLGAVDWAFPPHESFTMVFVVSLIGLVGGLLPAWRAMRLDPVEVLRNE